MNNATMNMIDIVNRVGVFVDVVDVNSMGWTMLHVSSTKVSNDSSE